MQKKNPDLVCTSYIIINETFNPERIRSSAVMAFDDVKIGSLQSAMQQLSVVPFFTHLGVMVGFLTACNMSSLHGRQIGPSGSTPRDVTYCCALMFFQDLGLEM